MSSLHHQFLGIIDTVRHKQDQGELCSDFPLFTFPWVQLLIFCVISVLGPENEFYTQHQQFNTEKAENYRNSGYYSSRHAWVLIKLYLWVTSTSWGTQGLLEPHVGRHFNLSGFNVVSHRPPRPPFDTQELRGAVDYNTKLPHKLYWICLPATNRISDCLLLIAGETMCSILSVFHHRWG